MILVGVKNVKRSSDGKAFSLLYFLGDEDITAGNNCFSEIAAYDPDYVNHIGEVCSISYRKGYSGNAVFDKLSFH